LPVATKVVSLASGSSSSAGASVTDKAGEGRKGALTTNSVSTAAGQRLDVAAGRGGNQRERHPERPASKHDLDQPKR
jgi:hypothetical protein